MVNCKCKIAQEHHSNTGVIRINQTYFLARGHKNATTDPAFYCVIF